MKKKIIIIVMSLIIMGVIGYMLWNNRTISTITLEINPSIEIKLNRNNKIVRIVPLNNDAKNIVKRNLYGKELDSAIAMIVDNVIDSSYIHGDEVPILIYATNNINNEYITNEFSRKFDERQIHATIIIIDNVTTEDRQVAKKYNISIAKAAYINEIIKENSNITIETLKEKPIGELRETKERGVYCDEGYTLEGSFCLKEINRINAEIGDICPEGYDEYEGKCYEKAEGITTDEYRCHRGLTLTNDNKCTGIEQIEGTPNFKCNAGEPIRRDRLSNPSFREAGDPDEYLCEDRSNAEYPTERCYKQEHAIINGKCGMGPKPLLPTPTGCAGDDVNYNGGCYDLTPDEPYICPNGDRYDTNTELCPDTFTYTKATGNYTCPADYTLNGSKCERAVTEPASFKKLCPEGYILLDSDNCINPNKTTDHIKGSICNERDSRLSGNMCIIYEVIEAKH